MPSWNEIAEAVPELAGSVQARFEAHGLGFLATLRRDGSPRISGIEPLIALGEVWLGMMPGSLKVRDLQRDPRLSLHSASADKAVTDGDARISGRAVEVPVFDEYRAAFERVQGQAPPPGDFNLFRLEIDEIMHLLPEGDHLLIESWHEAAGYRRVERR